MELYLKITAGLLLVHAFHLASPQDSTDSPGRTIDKSWLRELGKNTAGSQNTAFSEEEAEYDQGADATTVEPSNDYSSGRASGSMVVYNAEDNVSSHENGTSERSDDPTVVTTALPPTFPNGTTKEPEVADTKISPTTTSADPKNSSQINMTEAEEESHNSTMTPQTSTPNSISQNSTSLPDLSNRTDLQSTALAPGSNATQESTPEPEGDTGSTNGTTAVTAVTTPEANETSATSSSTTVFPSETPETGPVTTTAAVPDTPEKANKTDKGSASGSSSERGVAPDHHTVKRKGAWGAVLGIGVAVAFVGLVAYLIRKRKQQSSFSHRKLVEEYPSDPVLRLDNGEPLDLNHSGAAYYNPGLQGDNIQMTNFPGRHRH